MLTSHNQRHSHSTNSSISSNSASEHTTKKEITCFITEADDTVHCLALNPKATGMDCLKKFCDQLGLDEIEYFSFQYLGQNNETFWLNLRNRLRRQLPNHGPYYLYFRVKYFVPVHHLGTDECRNQIYYSVVKHLQSGLWDQGVHFTLNGELLAIMAMISFGKFHEPSSMSKYSCFWPDIHEPLAQEVIREAARLHRHLSEVRPSKADLQHYFLEKVSHRTPLYGTFFYEAKDYNEKSVLLGINPMGIVECLPQTRQITKCFRYELLEPLLIVDKVISLTFHDQATVRESVSYRCISRPVVHALQRYITEARCFYSCATITADIFQRTIHDQKKGLSHVISRDNIMKSSTKDYTFDVQLTASEVYERERSKQSTEPLRSFSLPLPSSVEDELPNSNESENNEESMELTLEDLQRQSKTSSLHTRSSESGTSVSASITPSQALNKLKEELRSKLASTLCRVCHRQQIVCVFLQCGHALCCKSCSSQFSVCFVCQSPVTEVRLFFQTWPDDIRFDALNLAASSAPY